MRKPKKQIKDKYIIIGLKKIGMEEKYGSYRGCLLEADSNAKEIICYRATYNWQLRIDSICIPFYSLKELHIILAKVKEVLHDKRPLKELEVLENNLNL